MVNGERGERGERERVGDGGYISGTETIPQHDVWGLKGNFSLPLSS
jgi:hypothetical protein